jgi:hypothetical protein
MSDVQMFGTQRETKQVDIHSAPPKLDDAVWLRWQQRNRVEDRIRAAHRRRVFMVLILIVVVGLILAYSAGAIA